MGVLRYRATYDTGAPHPFFDDAHHNLQDLFSSLYSRLTDFLQFYYTSCE
jgi:hypothetical protein